MINFKDLNDVLDFAIKNEQEAVDFYSNLSNKLENQQMKAVFEEFAQEEVRLKMRLTKIKEDGIITISNEEVDDLKIADYTVTHAPHPDMTYEEALVLAMGKEKAAFKLYMKLSERVSDAGLKDLFKSLAVEESKHKLRFELEYDEFVLREN